jgi:hypothetical protein
MSFSTSMKLWPIFLLLNGLLKALGIFIYDTFKDNTSTISILVKISFLKHGWTCLSFHIQFNALFVFEFHWIMYGLEICNVRN